MKEYDEAVIARMEAAAPDMFDMLSAMIEGIDEGWLVMPDHTHQFFVGVRTTLKRIEGGE